MVSRVMDWTEARLDAIRATEEDEEEDEERENAGASKGANAKAQVPTKKVTNAAASVRDSLFHYPLVLIVPMFIDVGFTYTPLAHSNLECKASTPATFVALATTGDDSAATLSPAKQTPDGGDWACFDSSLPIDTVHEHSFFHHSYCAQS
jgi:hypothetical protein